MLFVPTNMLSVGPGKTIDGTVVRPLAATVSVVLSTTAMAFPVGLNTSVRERSGDNAINWGLAAVVSRLIVDGDSTSVNAFTIFSTGALNPPLGNRALETNARYFNPLALWAVLDELEDPLPLPQETMPTPRAMSINRPIAVFFNPGTPRNMRDRKLDARNGIIAEGDGRVARPYAVCAEALIAEAHFWRGGRAFRVLCEGRGCSMLTAWKLTGL